MAMPELEMRILRAQLLPQFEYAESAFSYVGVVKQYDRSIRQKRAPGFEIVLQVAVKMRTVDIKKIDFSLAEMARGLVEGRANERGEGRVARVAVLDMFKGLFAVEAGMFVSTPRVDPIATRRQTEALHGLA